VVSHSRLMFNVYVFPPLEGDLVQQRVETFVVTRYDACIELVYHCARKRHGWSCAK